jgi:O-antigen/teichoic acid export membrane protein
VVSWSKSLPVSIGRPGLRVLAHGVETVVLIPLVVAFGSLWGATGAGAAVLISSVVFSALWFVLLARIRRGGAAVAMTPQPAPREAVPL